MPIPTTEQQRDCEMDLLPEKRFGIFLIGVSVWYMVNLIFFDALNPILTIPGSVIFLAGLWLVLSPTTTTTTATIAATTPATPSVPITPTPTTSILAQVPTRPTTKPRRRLSTKPATKTTKKRGKPKRMTSKTQKTIPKTRKVGKASEKKSSSKK